MPEARIVDALIAAHPDAYVCVLDRELRVVEVLSRDDPARWGYAVKDVLGRPLRDLLQPEEYARAQGCAGEVFASGESRRFEHGYRLPAGLLWCEVRFAPVRCDGRATAHLLAVVLDVSLRRHAEERLRESEARFATLARSLPVGVWRADADTRLQYANERFWEILGLDPGCLIGLDQHAHAARAEREGNVDAGSAGRWPDATVPGTIDVEMGWRSPRGGARWLRLRSESQHDAAGAYVGRVGAVVDVTELKQAQQELARHRDHLNELVAQRSAALERTHEALRRSERLAAVGTFAAGIAHQINNPLGGILLAAQFALAAPDDAERAREALRDIAQDARHCGRIVRGVLEFARGPKQAPGPCDLNAIARRCAAELAADAAERGARLRLDLAEGLPAVAGSEGALEQVLVSLVWSAVEASASEIEVASAAVDGAVELRVVHDGIAVARVGNGSPFDPLRAERPGTGLGLALAQGIAQAHGASVEPCGSGRCICVRFPRS